MNRVGIVVAVVIGFTLSAVHSSSQAGVSSEQNQNQGTHFCRSGIPLKDGRILKATIVSSGNQESPLLAVTLMAASNAPPKVQKVWEGIFTHYTSDALWVSNFAPPRPATTNALLRLNGRGWDLRLYLPSLDGASLVEKYISGTCSTSSGGTHSSDRSHTATPTPDEQELHALDPDNVVDRNIYKGIGLRPGISPLEAKARLRAAGFWFEGWDDVWHCQAVNSWSDIARRAMPFESCDAPDPKLNQHLRLLFEAWAGHTGLSDAFFVTCNRGLDPEESCTDSWSLKQRFADSPW